MVIGSNFIKRKMYQMGSIIKKEEFMDPDTKEELPRRSVMSYVRTIQRVSNTRSIRTLLKFWFLVLYTIFKNPQTHVIRKISQLKGMSEVDPLNTQQNL